jgi:hypothetical protein
MACFQALDFATFAAATTFRAAALIATHLRSAHPCWRWGRICASSSLPLIVSSRIRKVTRGFQLHIPRLAFNLRNVSTILADGWYNLHVLDLPRHFVANS